MTGDDLSASELATLRLFDSEQQPQDVDPLHFAKLLSMALIEQREGGAHLTGLGRKRLETGRNSKQAPPSERR